MCLCGKKVKLLYGKIANLEKTKRIPKFRDSLYKDILYFFYKLTLTPIEWHPAKFSVERYE